MASSSSNSSNSSSFHVPGTKYDVFISFRGEDIRSSFLSHLVRELHHHQIDAYVDDRLRPGDEISSALLQAIEEAFISLVIFSGHYASSRWCMEELVKIIECMERDQRIVIPVFYNVDPSDVRHQKRTFEEAFDKHQEKFKENVVKEHSWRYALRTAANLSGFHYPSKYENESELIEEIVKDVLEKLSHIFPDVCNGLVGIDESIECIESLLAIESSEVRILGIWGMGGIGKTTIAEAVFAKYSSQYESCCFLENVREEAQKSGWPYLFEKLVSELLEEKNLFLKGPAKARYTNVQRRLGRKKVFIVLDDVNTLDQLEHLIGKQICLGPGSRVIVTTRDQQILKNVHGVYMVQHLNFKNSLKLFCLNAFSKIYPENGYEKLSEMAVSYANGIPLALKVLGSFLYSRSIEVWESALRKLKNYPNKEIYDVLKLSYDGLDDLERSIFLDIAFFLKGKHKDDVIRLLDSCGFFAAIGIDNLQRKALITISDNNIIQMHDLTEQMGWEIVRQESIKDPGRRSRLKNPEDVYYVLNCNKGTDLVEGIMLDLSQTRDLHLHADTFKKMPKLRFLKLFFNNYWDRRPSNVYIHTDLESFSDELRYLEWSGCPLKSLPSTFCAEKLVMLSMQGSQVSKLWDGVQDLVNLKEIDLTKCKQLVELPDFTKASNLKRINLFDCESLCCVHPSILSIHTLKYLDVSACKELKSLTANILDLVNLEKIDLNRCKQLVELPDFSMAPNLKEIDLRGCTKLKSVKGLTHLKSLQNLDVSGCSNLDELSMSSEEMQELYFDNIKVDLLHSFFSHLAYFSNLRSLYLGYSRIESLPNELCFVTSLRELHLCGCEQLIELPDNLKALSQLTELDLSYCSNLRSLPELPPSIRLLKAIGCTSLETFYTKAVFSLYNSIFSFENCMRLDKHSIDAIDRGAVITMAGATLRNFVKWRRATYPPHVEVCYPGSKVPEWFRYRRSGACITVELDQPSQLLGLFLCCVISPPYPSNEGFHTFTAYCNLGDGQWEICENGSPRTGGIRVGGLKSDHVCMWDWYHPSHCTTINKEISFRFKTTFKKWKRDEYIPGKIDIETIEHDGVKGCGIYPIYVSDIQNFIQKMELDFRIDYKSIYEDLDELLSVQ